MGIPFYALITDNDMKLHLYGEGKLLFSFVVDIYNNPDHVINGRVG